MKGKQIIVILVAVCYVVVALPWKHQIALVNSLEVGRDEEPMVWQCHGCDANNKPLKSYIIQEQVKDVKAILSVYDEYTVLAFRYTATVMNIFQDLLWAIQVKDEHACDDCKVQKAMDTMWNSIRKETIEAMQKNSHTGRLIITGISLGGALTCLSYVDIVRTGLFQNIELVTFGAPRVGNSKWADWFNQQTPSTRYYITSDPIPVLPRCLTTLICNYKQTGTAFSCNKNKSKCEQASSSEQQFQFNDMRKQIFDGLQEYYDREDENQVGGIIEGIVDHITGYKNIRDYTLIEKQ